MTRLAEYRRLEAELAAQLQQLDAMKNDGHLKREIQFEQELRSLMAEYSMNLRHIIQILDPTPTSVAPETGRKHRPRQVKIYKNPHTGEVVETKGGNHRVLGAWKEQYGSKEVDSWLQ
ncbi:histone-like nucleoid-structuring protein, MvaT/MvaU family [Pseudomonas sp. BN411]|uniref:histone-like nucleoid-structuring protein, MvaT/MvaU family n=1 Tax=Pseudomonas sp. BN411 TaxID=2567887 RepID=UPI0024568FAA|nr:histone-like nucleoid-structuring protein, MvaT/MvaU family [Pseudomonas sp. BN411]MDH4562878.1 transcriptional regulator [Pseudomonas sp. BN411]